MERWGLSTSDTSWSFHMGQTSWVIFLRAKQPMVGSLFKSLRVWMFIIGSGGFAPQTPSFLSLAASASFQLFGEEQHSLNKQTELHINPLNY